jgi:hypothetical protein
MKDLLAVIVASLGSAAALTALANLYVKFIQKRRRNAVHSAQIAAFEHSNIEVAYGFGVRITAIAMAASFAFLCSEPAKRTPVTHENLLSGHVQALSAPVSNTSANAGA